MFLVNSVSVSDTAGMAAKQETGAKEKATDCGFVSTIKSGGAYSINWWTTITIRKFCRRHKQSIHRYVIFRFPVESKRKLVLSVRQCLAGFLFREKTRRRRLRMGWPGQSFFSQQTNCFYFDDDQDPDDKRILQWEFSARGGSHLSRKSDFIPKQQSQ